MELLDIYTSDNIPLGIAKPRNVVHAELTDWHRVTGIWIFNDKKEILCHKRSLSKDVNPWKWSAVFGGHVIAWETPEENAHRELYEEIGITVNDGKLTFFGVANKEKHKHILYTYITHCNKHIADFTFNDNEVDEVKWLPIPEVKAAILSKNFAGTVNEAVFAYIQSFIP